MIRKLTAILLAFVLTAALVACSSAAPATASPEPTAPPTPSPSPTPSPTPEPTPTPDYGQFGEAMGEAFFETFMESGMEAGEGFYRSEDVSAEITMVHDEKLTYYVIDIYIKYIENLKTAFSKDRYGAGGQKTLDQAMNHNAVAAVNGDYYNFDNKGVVIRNGEIYRTTLSDEDVCVIYRDGTMECYSPDEVDMDAIEAREPWQSWSFGPMLLRDGQPMTEFNSKVTRKNPRTAIGYYEPGHYCFVVVDGRQGSYSQGVTMAELSQLMYDLGCTEAYNLDGGKTSVMTFGTGVANQPYNGGRICSDIVYIGELDDGESWDLVTIPTNTPTPIVTMTATPKPTSTPAATNLPTPPVTLAPTGTTAPTATAEPTKAPTTKPTEPAQTEKPTEKPTEAPTEPPQVPPTEEPAKPTEAPVSTEEPPAPDPTEEIAG